MGAGLDIRIGANVAHDADSIHASLERLLFIGVSQQIGALDRGSRILEYFFESDDEPTAVAISDEVRDLIINYTDLILKEILVSFEYINNACLMTIKISIEWEKEKEENKNLTFSMLKQLGV